METKRKIEPMAGRRPTERLPYSAIVDRPRLDLGADVRVVVWPVINVEYWSLDRPMARQVIPPPTGVTSLPDIANWSWHEYGMRVGFWRLLEAFSNRGIAGTLSINGHVCEAYPRVAGAALEAGWEFMGHGDVQIPIHAVDDQAAMIHLAQEKIQRFTGKPALGWLGPGLTQTFETVDLLHEAGIRYIADWVLDDQPCRLNTVHGDMVAMPYSVELNDIPMMAVQHHDSQVMFTRVRDSFDRLWHEGREQPRIMAIPVHPFLSGSPHRIRYLEQALDYILGHDQVVFWTGEEIYKRYTENNVTVGAGA